MKEKILSIVAIILILAGAIKFDVFIYPTLDYFGKYVAVIVLNLMPLYFVFDFYRKKYNPFFILGFGILIGIIFYNL